LHQISLIAFDMVLAALIAKDPDGVDQEVDLWQLFPALAAVDKELMQGLFDRIRDAVTTREAILSAA